MSNIDFLIAYVTNFLSHAKITFSQGGVTDLPIKVFGFRTISICLIFNHFYKIPESMCNTVMNVKEQDKTIIKIDLSMSARGLDILLQSYLLVTFDLSLT